MRKNKEHRDKIKAWKNKQEKEFLNTFRKERNVEWVQEQISDQVDA